MSEAPITVKFDTGSDQPIYVAVDPGKTTGVAWYDPQFGLLDHLEYEDWRTVPRYVFNLHYGRPAVYILEEFRVNAKTSKKAAAPWSQKLNGALEVQAFQLGFPCHYQTAADAKSVVTDRVLRDAGIKAVDHARDAMRHLVLRMVKQRDPWAMSVLTGDAAVVAVK